MDADMRYARGEISREQWLAQRGTSSAAPPVPPPPPPRRRIGIRPPAVILIVVVAVAVALAIAFVWSAGQNPGGLPAPTYTGARQMTAQDLASLNASMTIGHAYLGNNSLWFGSGPTTLAVYLSPQAHDMAFEIQGLANPSIHVAAGSRITVVAVNVDVGEYHNWALTTQAPPYSTMPMMGGGMMSGTMMMAMSMLGPASSSGFWSQQVSFTATAGSYWYLCTYPGHAAGGMYGAFSAT